MFSGFVVFICEICNAQYELVELIFYALSARDRRKLLKGNIYRSRSCEDGRALEEKLCLLFIYGDMAFCRRVQFKGLYIYKPIRGYDRDSSMLLCLHIYMNGLNEITERESIYSDAIKTSIAHMFDLYTNAQ